MNATLRALGLETLLLGAISISNSAAQTAVRTESPQEFHAREKDQGFREFLQKVNEYAKLRDSLRGGTPAASKQDTAEKIAKHQETLAQRIQEARTDAKPGDVFTLDSQKSFRRAIDKAYAGKHAKRIQRTLAQGEPVKLDLYVNKPYPDRMPVTTVPTTLLQHLPKLPKKIEYRVVGDDLVLEDTESQLVIDVFSGAFPNVPAHSK